MTLFDRITTTNVLDAFPPIPVTWITQGGAVGVLAFVVLLMFLGQLIPARVYRALERDRDHWRDVALKSIGHTDMLMPAAEVAAQTMKALGDATTSVAGHAADGRGPS